MAAESLGLGTGQTPALSRVVQVGWPRTAVPGLLGAGPATTYIKGYSNARGNVHSGVKSAGNRHQDCAHKMFRGLCSQSIFGRWVHSAL